MWTIAAKVERNRSGSSSHSFRLYALPGQPVSPDAPIASPVDERHLGRYYLLEVAMTTGSQKASYPYMTNKHKQEMKLVGKSEALAHVAKNFPK